MKTANGYHTGHFGPAPDPGEKALTDALDNWAAWSRRDGVGEALPGFSPMFRSAYRGTDFDEMLDGVDTDIAEAVHTAVWELDPRLRWSVMCVKFGMGAEGWSNPPTGWSSPSVGWTGAPVGPAAPGGSLEGAYAAARSVLLVVLIRRHVINV
jgi:hypothetical protein